jgi:hypothetical protein
LRRSCQHGVFGLAAALLTPTVANIKTLRSAVTSREMRTWGKIERACGKAASLTMMPTVTDGLMPVVTRL